MQIGPGIFYQSIKSDAIENVFEKAKSCSTEVFSDFNLKDGTQSKLFLTISHDNHLFRASYIFSCSVNENEVRDKISHLFNNMKNQIHFDSTKKTSVKIGMLLKENMAYHKIPLYVKIIATVDIINGKIANPVSTTGHVLKVHIENRFCEQMDIPNPLLDSEGNFIF